MNYHTRWYHYIIVVFFYLITLIITASFIVNFALNGWYSLWLRILISAVFLLIVTLLIASHTHSMISNNSIELSSVDPADNRKLPPDCDKCLSDRPQRAHHCHVCKVCIRKMDHHCPWIANCVGELNQKSFMLLLFYSMLGSFFAFLFTMKAFIDTVYLEKDISLLVNSLGLMSIENCIVSLLQAVTIFGFILSGMMGLSICILLGIQVNELRCGMTAVELKIYKKTEECPYYCGNFKENFKAVFGENVLLWFLPMNTTPQDKEVPLNNNYVALT